MRRLAAMVGAALLIAMTGWDRIEVRTAAAVGWTNVDLKDAREHLASLGREARTEQLRDWALLAAYMQTEVPAERPNGLLAFEPLRLDFLGDVVSHHAGAVRWITLHGGDMVVVLPETKADRLIEIGHAADEYRALHGAPPPRILAFAYTLDAEAPQLQLSQPEMIASDRVFNAEAGYREFRITTAAELEAFLVANLDLVYVQREGTGLRVGGRALAAGLPRLVTSADLAILYQADRNLETRVRQELERKGLREAYESRVHKAVATFMREHPEALSQMTVADLTNAAHKELPYETFLQNSIDQVVNEQPPSLGFSLDPRVNYPEIAAALRAAVQDHPDQLVSWLKAEITREMVMADNADQGDIDAFRQMLAKASEAKIVDRESSVASLLQLASNHPPPATPQASPAEQLWLDLLRDPRPMTERVDEIAQEMLAALHQKAPELTRIATALDAKKLEPLLDLRRFLDADIVGITIDAHAPAYRIKDLQELLTEAKLPTAADGVWTAAIADAIKTFQQQHELEVTGRVDTATWSALLEAAPDKARELEVLEGFLQLLEQRRNYQCARYDGDFQGTEVGMTLFYTDLVMKLWAFSGEAQTPPVENFASKVKFPVPSIYWDEIRHNSSTRSWLGGRLDNVTVQDNDKTMVFAPVATRLYNASMNPLYPGKEMAANFMSARFSSWWNDHYREVADYEPQYHRLNQLMKWSAIMQVLAKEPPDVLQRLTPPAGARDLRFNTWWQSRTDLKVHWNLNFLNRPDEPTECLALVESETFPLAGRLGELSGGVSLFKREELTIKTKSDLMRRSLKDVPVRAIADAAFEKATIGKETATIPLRNGRTLSKAGAGEFSITLAKEESQLNGHTAALASDKLGWKAEAAADGMRIDVGDSQASFGYMSITQTSSGLAVRVEESSTTGTAQFLNKMTDSTNESVAGESMRLMPILTKDGQALFHRVGGQDWAVMSALESAAPNAKGIRVAVGEDVALIQPADVKTINERVGSWLRVESFRHSASQLGAESVDGPPASAMPFVLRTADDQIPGMLDKAGWYVERGTTDAGVLADRLARTAPSLIAEDLNALSEAGAQDAALMVWRGADGRHLAGTFGTDAAGAALARAQELFPTAAKGFRGVIVSKNAGGRLDVTEAGFLRLPADADAPLFEQARRLVAVVEREPGLASKLHQLRTITLKDVQWLESLRDTRPFNYVRMRAVSTGELGPNTMADMHFSATDPHVVYRKGDEFFTFDVPNPQAVEEARAWAEQALKLDSATRDWTITEFRTRTRPLFDALEQLRKLTDGELVTIEKGELNLETFYRMHGGEARFRIRRDIPDMRASVNHLKTSALLSLDQSAFLSTVPLDGDADPAFAGVRQQVATLRLTLVEMRAPTTFEAFVDALGDEDLQQITLVARCRDNGLVFADRWVDEDTLRQAAERGSDKQMLHLISDCGMSLASVFANTGHFARVFSTRFAAGDVQSLELALDTVTRLTQTFTTNTAAWTVEDLEGFTTSRPELATVLERNSKRHGRQVETDIRRLLDDLTRSGLDVMSDAVQSLWTALRSRVVRVVGMTIDRGVDQANAAVFNGKDRNTRKAGSELRRAIQDKYE